MDPITFARPAATRSGPAIISMDKWGFMPAASYGPEVVAAYGQLITDFNAAMGTLVDMAVSKVKEVDANADLSGTGKIKRRLDLGDAAMQDVRNATDRVMSKLQADLDAARKKLPQGLASLRQVVQRRNAAMLNALASADGGARREIVLTGLVQTLDLDLREIRDNDIRPLEPAARHALLAEAAEGTGEASLDVLLAFSTTPGLRPFVPVEQLQEAVQRWQERNDPEAYTAVSTIQTTMSAVRGNSHRAKEQIAAATGVAARFEDKVKLDATNGREIKAAAQLV